MSRFGVVRAAHIRAIVMALLALLLLPLAASQVNAQTITTDAATQELAERYAPLVAVRTQSIACEDGEPYLPVAVDTVFGDSQVVLRGPDDQVVVTAPTAADLAGLPEGYYLDFPGDPLAPGCDYEKWFQAKAATPAVYARVATDPAKPNRLALQYWFWWVYNDWNDRHEGDWEMIQLDFPAATAAEALTVAPTEVAFAQHEGSEVAAWTDPKLVRDGDNVVVYPAQGSHAAYFAQSLWFGKSAASGFGCDNTTTPATGVTPEVLMLPSDDQLAQVPWLTFEGRWGEKAPSFNNGPTGPNTKDQWAAPIVWQEDEGRPTAVAIPPVAGGAVDTFCNLTTAGSMLFLELLDQPWKVLLGLGALIAVIAVSLSRTKWKGAALQPLAQVRASGQVVVAAFAWWWRNAAVTLPLGAAFFALAVVVTRLQAWLLQPRPIQGAFYTEIGSTPSTGELVLAGLLALLFLVVGAWIFSATEHAVADDAADIPPRLGSSMSKAFRRPAAVILALLTGIAVVVLGGSIILIVVLLFLLARWGVASAAAAVEDVGVGAGLRRSSEVSEGSRWHTLGATVMLLLIGFALPGVVGAVLLLLTSWSFLTANLISLALASVLIPVAAAGFALLFMDLRERRATIAPKEPVAAP